MNNRLAYWKTISLLVSLVGLFFAFSSHASAACTVNNASYGDTINGTLDTGDCQTSPASAGYYAEQITFTGNAGDGISALASWSFDGYLYLTDASNTVLTENDDFNDANHSKIIYTLPASGTYNLWVTSYNSGDTGSYNMTLNSVILAPCITHNVFYGGTVNGTIDSEDCETVGYYAEKIIFSGSAGDKISLTGTWATSSGYVSVIDNLTNTEIFSDQDANNPASKTFGPITLPTTGTYTVWVSTLTSGQTGNYSVNLNVLPVETWENVGTGPVDSMGSSPSFAFDPHDNTPYVAYTDGGDNIIVKKYNGTQWTAVGNPFTAGYGQVSRPSLAISAGGDKYVSFTYCDNMGLCETNAVEVMRFMGVDWQSTGFAKSGNSFKESLDIKTSSAKPCIAWKDNSNSLAAACYMDVDPGPTEVLEWRYLDATLSNVPSSLFSSFADSEVSLSFIGNNPVVTSYKSASSHYAFQYHKYDTPSGLYEWVSLPGVASVDDNEISMAGYGTKIYFAFRDSSRSNKLTVKTIDTSMPSPVWTTIGDGISTGPVRGISVVVDPLTQQPITSYYDSNQYSVQKFDGSSWRFLSDEGSVSPSPATGITSIAINPGTNLPWVAVDGSVIVVQFVTNQTSGSGGIPVYVNLDINAIISLACTDAVTMNPITGTGKSIINTNNQADCLVMTNNSSGYSLSWQASSPNMINAQNDIFSSYTPITSNTPETWNVPNTQSAWGAKLAATSEGYNGGAGGGPYTYPTPGWGSDDSYQNGKYLNISSASPVQIMQKSTNTSASGEKQSIMFGAEVGADKIQPTGTYTTNVTITATTLGG